MKKRYFTNKQVVVTGAAGFIGSALVANLNENDFDRLLLADNLEDGEKWKNLKGKRFDDIIPIKNTHEYIEKAKEQIGAVIHLGACSDTTCADADYLLDNNYKFTINLAKLAVNNNIRFIYASSAATYGDGKRGFSDDENSIGKLYPLNMYGYSKQLADTWLQKNKLMSKVVALKYFNVFGPNENHKKAMASVVFKMTNNLLNDQPIRLFKSNDRKNYQDGEQKRDFIYVKDAVQMTCSFLEEEFHMAGGIFNIGTGVAVTWNRLAKAIFAALNKEVKIEYIDMPQNLNAQYQNYTCADMRKYINLLKTKNRKFTTISIEDAIKDYVQNYLLADTRW